jgi:hypothetical protein
MGDVLGEDKDLRDVAKLSDVTTPNTKEFPMSRSEHMASMDTMASTLRLEMNLMFEEYLGKKSTGSTVPNTRTLVDSHRGSESSKRTFHLHGT